MADKRHLTMYVHMHWAYNYPYAARTWAVDDWRGYASGLKQLGYNTIMLWPMSETMPDPLTASDKAFLEKIRDVIRVLHDDVGFDVWICIGPNTVGNDRAADYTFETRPFFQTDLRLNPGDPAETDELFRRRRVLFEYIREADGIQVIDSDPGGYIGSTNTEFANLLRRYMEEFGEYNPKASVFYWMWVGWESYNAFWQQVAETGEMPELQWDKRNWREVISLLKTFPQTNWGLFASNELHFEVVEELGVNARTIFNPYGLIEGEPTFPLTNYDPGRVAQCLAGYDTAKSGLGAMGNAQTHVVQLPHTYLFAELAQGAAKEDVDIAAFARELVPQVGDVIADGWKSLWPGKDTARMREVADMLAAHADDRFSEGRYSALLLGGANRFVKDLSLQLLFRAASVDAIAAIDDGSNVPGALSTLVAAWSEWQARTGFRDAYGDAQGLLPALGKLNDPAIDAVLRDFNDWRDPSVRHGIALRLIDAVAKRAGL